MDIRSVERILSIPVSSLYFRFYIWNTCYLEWLLFGILSYSTGFSKFHWFHSLSIYYRIPSVLRINQLSFYIRICTENVLQSCRDEVTKNWGYLPFNGGPRICLGS